MASGRPHNSIYLFAAFGFLLFVNTGIASPFEPCNICSFFVSEISEVLKDTKITKEKVLDTLHQACQKIPSKFDSSDECDSFVELYGAYILDLIVAYPDSKSVCSDLGLCGDDSKWQILLPSFQDNEIVYKYSQPVESLESTKEFYYKFFIGNKTLELESYYDYIELEVSVEPSDGLTASFELENGPEGVSDTCSDEECEITVIPLPGQWYYLTVAPSSSLHGDTSNTGTLEIRAVEKVSNLNSKFRFHRHRNAYLIVILLVLPLVIGLKCVLFCCCLRTMEKRNKCQQKSKKKKKKNSRKNKTSISLQSIEVQKEPEPSAPAPAPVSSSTPFPFPTANPVMQVPMVYYYHPQGVPMGNQYIQMQPGYEPHPPM